MTSTKELLTLRVNGEAMTVAAEPHHTLLEVLREDNRAIVRATRQASKAATASVSKLRALSSEPLKQS